jgi:hypothetical protein
MGEDLTFKFLPSHLRLLLAQLSAGVLPFPAARPLPPARVRRVNMLWKMPGCFQVASSAEFIEASQ